MPGWPASLLEITAIGANLLQAPPDPTVSTLSSARSLTPVAALRRRRRKDAALGITQSILRVTQVHTLSSSL